MEQFFDAPKDRFSNVLAKNNALTCFYVPLMGYMLHINEVLYDLGSYSYIYLVLLLLVLEIGKFYHLKKAFNVSDKKRKPFKVKKVLKRVGAVFIGWFSLYFMTVCLGAPFLSDFEQTFMFVSYLTVVGVVPVLLHDERIESFYELIDLPTTPSDNMVLNMHFVQLHGAVIGAWLGAIPIPLDWNRPWQQWPTTCVLGCFIGFWVANVVSLVLQKTNIVKRTVTKKRKTLSHIL